MKPKKNKSIIYKFIVFIGEVSAIFISLFIGFILIGAELYSRSIGMDPTPNLIWSGFILSSLGLWMSIKMMVHK
jgi:hypothetical protein